MRLRYSFVLNAHLGLSNSGCCIILVDRDVAYLYNPIMPRLTTFESSEIARLALDVASDKQAYDVVMLDIREVSDFTDFFVILTGNSSRHLSSLIDDIETALESRGAVLHHREGSSDSGWVLMDFGDLIVHLFRDQERDYYDIEDAWPRGTEVIRIQ